MMAPEGYIWCGRKGDLTLYLTNVELPGAKSSEPALYIRNEQRRVQSTCPLTGAPQQGCPAHLVLFRDFWIFRPEDRDRGRDRTIGEMVLRLGNMSEALYGFDLPEYRFRIHDAILEFADDVKNLRPPRGLTREEWAARWRACGMSLKIDGKLVI